MDYLPRLQRNPIRDQMPVEERETSNIETTDLSEISAYHEAGHAFVAIYVGARICTVTVDPDWDDGPERFGDIQIEWSRNQFSAREYHEKSIMVALGGPVAEMIHRGEPYHPGLVPEWAMDWQQACKAVSHLFPSEQQQLAHLEQVSVQLYRLLDREDHWAALSDIVDNLLAHETLEGEVVEDIVRQWLH